MRPPPAPGGPPVRQPRSPSPGCGRSRRADRRERRAPEARAPQPTALRSRGRAPTRFRGGPGRPGWPGAARGRRRYGAVPAAPGVSAPARAGTRRPRRRVREGQGRPPVSRGSRSRPPRSGSPPGGQRWGWPLPSPRRKPGCGCPGHGHCCRCRRRPRPCSRLGGGWTLAPALGPGPVPAPGLAPSGAPLGRSRRGRPRGLEPPPVCHLAQRRREPRRRR